MRWNLILTALLAIGGQALAAPPTPPAPGASSAEPLAPVPTTPAAGTDEPVTKAARKFRVVPPEGEAEVVLFRPAPPPRQFITVVREASWTIRDGIILSDDSVVAAGSRLRRGQPVPADAGVPGLSIKTDEEYDLPCEYLVLADDVVLTHNVLFPKGFPLWGETYLAYGTRITTAKPPVILKPRRFESGLQIPDENQALPPAQQNRELELGGQHRREVTATVTELRSELSTRPTLGTVDGRIASSLSSINRTLVSMDRRLGNVETGLNEVRRDVKELKARSGSTIVTYHDSIVCGCTLRHWSNGVCEMYTTAGWQPAFAHSH